MDLESPGPCINGVIAQNIGVDPFLTAVRFLSFLHPVVEW